MSLGFVVSGVVGAVQTAESLKMQEKLQAEAILAQEKQMEKQHKHEIEMLKAQQAMQEAQQQQQIEEIVDGSDLNTEIDSDTGNDLSTGTNSNAGQQSVNGQMTTGTYDEEGNFHLSDGSGYVDTDGNFHLADGSGYYDKNMSFYYSDGTGYLDKNGNFYLSDGTGYYDKDGNFYPADKNGYYDKDGNFVEDAGEFGDEVDERYEDAVLIGKNTDESRRSTYSSYYKDFSDSDDEELYETSSLEARTLENQEYFENYISEGVFTHRELQSVKENIESGRMNFFTIEYMYEEDIFTLDQANAALDMLQYFQTHGSF